MQHLHRDYPIVWWCILADWTQIRRMDYLTHRALHGEMRDSQLLLNMLDETQMAHDVKTCRNLRELGYRKAIGTVLTLYKIVWHGDSSILRGCDTGKGRFEAVDC